MEDSTTIIVIPFESDTYLEIFEMEAIPILREKYDFSYRKEFRVNETIVIINCNEGPDPSFPHLIREVLMKLFKGVKAND